MQFENKFNFKEKDYKMVWVRGYTELLLTKLHYNRVSFTAGIEQRTNNPVH